MTYTLIGTPVSLYTGKVRGYLRWKNVPFTERLSTREVFKADILPRVGWSVIPVVIHQDGSGPGITLQDTTEIIAYVEANEPGLISYEIAVSETGKQIVIHEVFEDGDALAFHLSETAAQFFPQLVEFATPGPFIFRGDVPDELRAAAYQMEMGAIFTGDWEGFERE